MSGSGSDPTVNLQPATVTGRKITPNDVNTQVNTALAAKESQTDAQTIGATVAALTPRMSAVEQTASTLLAGQSSLVQQNQTQATMNASMLARLTALEAGQTVQDNRLTTLETATPPSPSPPGPPGQPTVTAHTQSTLSYSWAAPTTGSAADHYIGEYKLTPASTWTTLSKSLLGGYISFPGGTTYANDLSTFITAMGAAPAVQNVFIDDSQTWGSAIQANAAFFAALYKDVGAVPVFSIPLATTADTNVATILAAITAGSHDADFNAMFASFVANGFGNAYLRLGWEMNLAGWPWSITGTTIAAYISAFQHVAALAHAYAGASFKIIWCPNANSPIYGGTTAGAVNAAFYPGNTAVDVVAIDIFGPGAGGPSLASMTDVTGTVYSLKLAAQHAVANSKPFAICETTETVAASPAFVAAMQSVLLGVSNLVIDHIIIVNDPSQAKPLADATAGAAWKAFFNAVTHTSTNVNLLTTSAKLSSATPSTSYDFRVTAVSAAGFPGNPSTVRTASTDAQPVTVATESPDGLTLTSASGSITDANGVVWALTPSVAPARGPFQITINQGAGPVIDPITQGVVLMKYYNPAGATALGVPKHVIVQQNDQGSWYYPNSLIVPPPGANYTQIAGDPAAPPPSGVFTISAGRIIDPNGNDFVAKGINVQDLEMGVATKAKLLSLFPGINFVRLAVGAGADGFDSAQSTASILAYVASLTASPNPIVVEIEDHWQAGGTLVQSVRPTAHPLYTTLANALKTNTYAWFGTFNEPGNIPGGTLSETTQNHVDVYNAVRATGAPNIIMGCTSGGSPFPGGSPFASLGPSSYAGMTNFVWDIHAYNWETNANTNQSQVDTFYAGVVSAAQAAATTADGVIPVIFAETGYIDYAPGGDPNTEVNGGRGTNQVVTSVLTIGKLSHPGGAKGNGGAIWLWNGRPTGWATVTDLVGADNSTLTQHGIHTAGLIAAA